MSPSVAWYAQRLAQMSPTEVVGRLGHRWHQESWSLRRALGLSRAAPPPPNGVRGVSAVAVGDALNLLPSDRRTALLATARTLMGGSWEVLGHTRHDMSSPEWSLDPVSGDHFPEHHNCFRIAYRSESDPRWVKQVWELSRHHHLTILAAAWRLTGDEEYARMIDRQLRSWWRHNEPLSGVNWASGIEIGIRLISWVWIRRLLDSWPGITSLFDENNVAVEQVYWHQRYLATFKSVGSSANNHVIAEAAGQVVASCAFRWFPESERWCEDAITLLESELGENTFRSGVNRELAFDYHGFVAELGMVAGAEADATGRRFSDRTWLRLRDMLDVLAAVVDTRGRPPRQGDGDDGRGLVFGDSQTDRWASVLAMGGQVFGPMPWWPSPQIVDASSLMIGALMGRSIDPRGRPSTRPSHFGDAGLTILRSAPGATGEIWCRCDGGPHGFLSIAAHAHADALSVEVRHNGVDILADAGTFCYQGEPSWRRYFRSTIAHNTVEIDQRDQSESGGPFLWTRKAHTEVAEAFVDGQGPFVWRASHDGYSTLSSPVRHERTVTLDPATGCIQIVDELHTDGAHLVRLAFHLGPEVEATLDANRARLAWQDIDGARSASIDLPTALVWSAHRGETAPILGWYSGAYGCREPSITLVGEASLGAARMVSTLRFASNQAGDASVGDTSGGISTDIATARSNR